MASQLDPQWRQLVAAISREVASQLKRPPVAAEWLNIHNAAAYLDLTTKALRIRLTKPNPPPSHKMGGHLRFRKEELDAWVRGEC